jgi:hypothetical protein
MINLFSNILFDNVSKLQKYRFYLNFPPFDRNLIICRLGFGWGWGRVKARKKIAKP